MNSIEGILKLADNEFSAIVQNGKFRSREEIDSVYKLMDIVKDAHCIWKYEEEESSGYSEDGGSYRSMRSYDSYDDGPYSHGRGRGAKRYADGRYAPTSRRGYGGNRSMNYSRADAKHDYIEELRDMMESAPDEQTRQSIQRMITQMEQS